ncbi:hypothetical protein, partial [Scytonema sp. NUACC26]|uniref:hypothetical protein n=1 Tax=Scytonema sp. NUACC26 TaxID=3140176 RepID=UPI0038B2C192
MRIIQPSLGMTNPFLTIGESLSPPKFLLQRKFNFPPLISRTLQPPSFIQGVSLSDSEPLNMSWEDFPKLSVNNLMMEEAIEIPSNKSETNGVVHEIKNKTDVRQADFTDRIDTQTVSQSVKKLPQKTTKLSQTNQKKVKSKTSKKQSKSKKSVQDTTVTQKVDRTSDTPIVQAALTQSTTPNPKDKTADTPIVQTALTQATTSNPISTRNTAVENEQELLVATTSVRQPTLDSPQTSFPQDINFNKQDIQPSQSTPTESVNPTVEVDRTDRTADTPIVQTAIAQPTTPNPISTSNTVVENQQASSPVATSVRQPTLNSPQTSFPQDINFNKQDIQSSQSSPTKSVNPTVDVDRTDRTVDTPIVQTANPTVEVDRTDRTADTPVLQTANPTVDVDRTDRTANTPVLQTALTQPTTPNPISTSNTVVENKQASP